MRVTRSRELVAAGYMPAVVARVGICPIFCVRSG
jgi:hypothetical protein